MARPGSHGGGYDRGSSGTPGYREPSPHVSAGRRIVSDVVPAPSGFRNIMPRSRDVRRQLQDKETLEKARLRARTGGFHKYEDYGKDLTAQAPESSGYIDEASRFITDVAGEEKRLRQDAAARRARQILSRREVNADREERRWAQMEDEKREEEEHWDALRADGRKALRNKGSVPYDPLTLRYHDSHDGLRLKHADDSTRYRAALRAKHLHEKGRGVGYDLLTGSDAPMMVPPRPPSPLPAAVKPHPSAYAAKGTTP